MDRILTFKINRAFLKKLIVLRNSTHKKSKWKCMEGHTCLKMWNILFNWNVFFETTNLTNSKNLVEKWQIIIVDYPLGGRNYERAPLSSLCEKYVRYSHFHSTWKFLSVLSVLRPYRRSPECKSPQFNCLYLWKGEWRHQIYLKDGGGWFNELNFSDEQLNLIFCLLPLLNFK